LESWYWVYWYCQWCWPTQIRHHLNNNGKVGPQVDGRP
jgi:hypothetical protein